MSDARKRLDAIPAEKLKQTPREALRFALDGVDYGRTGYTMVRKDDLRALLDEAAPPEGDVGERLRKHVAWARATLWKNVNVAAVTQRADKLVEAMGDVLAALAEAQRDVARLREERDEAQERLEDVKYQVDTWADAYPPECFTGEFHEALRDMFSRFIESFRRILRGKEAR